MRALFHVTRFQTVGTFFALCPLIAVAAFGQENSNALRRIQPRPFPRQDQVITRPAPIQPLGRAALSTNIVLPGTGNTFSRPTSTFSRPGSTFNTMQPITPVLPGNTNLHRGALFGTPQVLLQPPATPQINQLFPLNTPFEVAPVESFDVEENSTTLDLPPGSTLLNPTPNTAPVLAQPTTPPPLFVIPSANFPAPVQPAPVVSIDLPPGSFVRRPTP